MRQPLEIRFLGMDPSPAVEAAAREKAAKLDRFSADLMSCRVTIELRHKHKHQGKPYAVRIDVTAPGHELCVDRVADEDVYVARRDPFDDVKRRIEDSVRHDRGQQKVHAEVLHGKEVRLDAEGRCGFIRTAEGDEYWFGPENVADVPFEHVEPAPAGSSFPTSLARAARPSASASASIDSE